MGRFTNVHLDGTRKPEHAQDRLRLERSVVLELKRNIMGRVETKTVLTQDELKVIQEQGEKEVRDLEAAVTYAQIDKNLAVPVYDTKTGERSVIVPKRPHLTYYEKHSKIVLTVHLCRTACLLFSILMVILNTWFLILWIYADYNWPLEFFRVMFEKENARINRIVLEFKLNLCLGLLSFIYSIWGMSVSTVFTWTPLVTGVFNSLTCQFEEPIKCLGLTLLLQYFTWSVMFILPFLTFLGVHIFNLSRVDSGILKRILLNSLWTYGYYKGSPAQTVAWNQAQFSLKCCGVNDYTDWYVDWGYWINRTDKPIEPIDQKRFPESCCPFYELHQEFIPVKRTSHYSLRMLYCQVFPKAREGCFLKLIEFFQFFTAQVIWICIFQVAFMTMAAGWAFGSHVRYKHVATQNKLYIYTCKDWALDFFFIRIFKHVKDMRKKRIGPAPLNLEFDNAPFDEHFLEQRRPRLIDDELTKSRHLEENEEEAKLDEIARQNVLPFVRDPIVEILNKEL